MPSSQSSRKRLASAPYVAIVTVLFATVCTQIFGCEEEATSDGDPPECADVADCDVSEPECRTAVACTDGACEFEDEGEGTLLTEQIAGDCLTRFCNGRGGVVADLAADDVPDDGNPCTFDECVDGEPTNTAGAEAPCSTGPVGTAGVGACVAGIQQCSPAGLPFGPCVGEVLPATEDCTGAPAEDIDEDCDGETNEDGANCICGDQATSAGEECDDGNADDGDDCTTACKLPFCGDGFVQAGVEECDDGPTPLDGCDDCQSEPNLDVVAGSERSCAILAGARVKCWGSNAGGALGLGNVAHRGDTMNEMGAALPIVDLGTGKTAVSLALGSDHTCALLNDASVKCWGDNFLGQLGLGDTVRRGDGPGEMGDSLPAVSLGTGKTALAIAAGDNHTCVVLNDGSVKCWGLGSFGQLGLGDTSVRGDGPSEMGNSLPAVSLGTGKTATAITAGFSHTCALLNDGSVKCWGFNVQGQLGLGDTSHRGDGPSEMGNALPAVNLGTGKIATAIAAGNAHTCALLNDATIKCWGANANGQLGQGDTTQRGSNAGQMGDALAAVSLGAGKSVTALTAGGSSACAILNDGSLKCWGGNAYGMLGLGDTLFHGDGPGEMGDALPAVSLGAGKTAAGASVGQSHTCALLSDGAVKCWGRSFVGALGQGDTLTRGDQPGEMGDALPHVRLYSGTW